VFYNLRYVEGVSIDVVVGDDCKPSLFQENLKKDNEKGITRLREEKEKLQLEFEEMKYSGE
jgi:hypothetical protein